MCILEQIEKKYLPVRNIIRMALVAGGAAGLSGGITKREGVFAATKSACSTTKNVPFKRVKYCG